MIKKLRPHITVGSILLVAATAGCNSSDIVGLDAKFYTLVEANGQPVALGKEQLVVGSVPVQDTTCDLLLRAGRIFTNGSDNRYDAVVGMNVRCTGGAGGLAYAAEHGTFSLSSGTFHFRPITIEGLRVLGGTRNGNTVRLDVVVDAQNLAFEDFPPFSVDKQFPLQLRFIKTAED